MTKLKTEFDFKAGCKAIDNYIGYHVGDYGFIEGPTATTETEMMREIYANGPLVCAMDAHDQFMLGYDAVAERNEGVFMGVHMNDTDHDVEVAGWGVTPSGRKYWVVRNSWGTYWGEGGWFKLARGVNQNNIETDCAWAKPYSSNLDLVLDGVVLGDYHRGVHRISDDMPPASLAAKPVIVVAQPMLMTVVAMVSSGATVLISRLLQRPRGLASKPLLA